MSNSSKLKRSGLMVLGLIALALACVLVFRRWSNAPSKKSATFALEQYTTHVQHPRTGLCFLVANDSRGFSFTHVPCTPEVLREIGSAR